MGYVAPLSVFAFVDKEKDPLHGELVIGGIPWEFVQRLEQMGGAFIEWPKANVDFDIELYKLLTQLVRTCLLPVIFRLSCRPG